MGTFVVDLISGKPLLFSKTFGIATTGVTTPVWGGISGNILNQVDLQLEFATKLSNSNFLTYSSTTLQTLNHLEDTKLDILTFTGYSATTLNNFNSYTADTKNNLDSKLNTSTFTGYTASTDLILNNKLDINIFTGYTASTLNTFNSYTALTDQRINAKINDYNNYNTQSNILALAASAYTNQKFWATDTKTEWISKYVDNISGYTWIGTSLNYDSATDTFYLGTTADGETLNLGQEIFLNCINRNTQNVTTLNPKVFVVLNTDTETSSVMGTILARANDISDSSVYGVNTTTANVGQYYKLLTYGLLNNVNTSNWPVGTELYVSTTTRGDLTSIKPDDIAISIGRVLRQGATDGIIFVNTIRSIENISTMLPTIYDYSYFNADLVTTSAGTFYLNLRNNKGTISASTQTVSVNDNQISGITRDSLSIVFPTPITYTSGGYVAKLDVSVDTSQANEKIYLEVYKANQFGNVIDSGLASQQIGELGVRPVLFLSSNILDLPANTLTGVILDGILPSGVTINTGERFRFHIRCEKIGTPGNAKTFTIYYGSNYNSYLRFPHYTELDELYDVVVNNSVTGNFLKRNSSGIWTGEFIQMSDVSGLTGYTATTEVKINQKLDKAPTIYIVTGSSYSPIISDYIIGVDSTTGGTVNINLPQISTIGKLTYIIKDQKYYAAINNININSFVGNYIENNQTTVSIAINGGSISIYNNGLNNWYIF